MKSLPMWLIIYDALLFAKIVGVICLANTVIILLTKVIAAPRTKHGIRRYITIVLKQVGFEAVMYISGAIFFLVISIVISLFLRGDISWHFQFDPCGNPVSLVIYILVIGLLSMFIYLFTRSVTLAPLIPEKKKRIVPAVILTVVGAPTFFLIPAKIAVMLL